MSLSKDELTDIILLAGSGSCCKVAEEFNRRHMHIMHDNAAKLTEESQKTGRVADQLRRGSPQTSTAEGIPTVVLAAFKMSPQKSTLQLSAECSVS